MGALSEVVEPFDEAERGREGHIVVQLLQDSEFELQDLLLRVSVVCNVDKVINFWHIDLLVLASDKHRSDA